MPDTKSNFQKCLTAILAYEGGYANDPDDRGGETYRGIARKFHPSWSGWSIIDDIKKIRKINRNEIINNPKLNDMVADFYKKNFYADILDMVSSVKAVKVCESWVLHGGITWKFVQRALGIADDGIVGKVTQKKFIESPDRDFLNAFANIRISYVENIVKARPTQAKYLNGWKARILK